MASYQRYKRDPAVKGLFNRRITTLSELEEAIINSSFVAIDVEHVDVTSKADRHLHQVGLAYIPRLDPSGGIAPNVKCKRLKTFYWDNNLQAVSIHVDWTQKQRDDRRVWGGHGLPRRSNHRYGLEKTLALEDVEARIIHFIESLDERNLILMGFDMLAEWKYLSKHFPRVLPLFSAWVDLCDIAKDITSTRPPSLETTLTIAGYRRTEIHPNPGPRKKKNKRRTLSCTRAHNASHDAVATCALANALLHSKFQEDLKLLQQQLSRTARVFSLEGHPKVWDRFIVTVRVEGPLPRMLSDGMSMAKLFVDYAPKWVGKMSEDVATVYFHTRQEMFRFITATHGSTLESGDTLSVEEYVHPVEHIEEERRRREEKRQEKMERRLKFMENEIEVFAESFSHLYVTKSISEGVTG